jgi:hypothetical protein
MHITYDAPPTVARFMKSEAFFRLIAGPVGSSKTTGCIMELFRRACAQAPAADGLRYTRFVVVRQTLKQLMDTVVKDVLQWLGPVAELKVQDKTIYLNFSDVRSEWIFIPLEDPEDQRRLLSMQLTGAWMSEAIEMDVGLIPAISGRIPRYPSGSRGVATWGGIIADTNMPPEGSEWWKLMTDPSPDQQVFIQPSGMSAEAENLEWLNQNAHTITLPPEHPERRAQGRLYYERLSRNNNPDWVRRYVHAEFGDDPSGSAVFRESYKPSWHGVHGLEPVSAMPLIIGQDFGRDPCAVICQLDHKGRLLALQEVVAEDIGLEMHLQSGLRPALSDVRFLGRPVAIVGDPSGVAKSTIYEETTFDVLKRYGFMAFPAPTNDIDPRLRAVEAFMLQSRDTGPALLVDKDRCPTLHRALAGGYRYGKTKAGQRKPAPEKNEFSHIADAFQYACLAAHGGMANLIFAKLHRRPRRHGVGGGQRSAAGWT